MPQDGNIYTNQYEIFIAWCRENEIQQVSKWVVSTYIAQMSMTYRAPTLWSIYSVLQSALLANNRIDITAFKELKEMIENNNASLCYHMQLTNIFTRSQVKQFLTEAPDSDYLVWKISLIFGIAGACKKEDLRNLQLDDIEDKGNILIVKLRVTNTSPIMFTISDRICDCVKPIELYRKYIALRPPNTIHRYLFVLYQKGMCTAKRIGIDLFGKIPKYIAAYLKLKDECGYTGYGFECTLPGVFDNVDVTSMREHGWNLTAVKKPVYIQPCASTSIEISDSDDESENNDIKNVMVDVTDTQILLNENQPTEKSEQIQNLTAGECDLFGDYISKHLQQLPADIALNLQSGIHDLVMRTRLEYAKQHPLKVPLLVKQEKQEEELNTKPFVNVPNNKITSNKCSDKRIRDSDPPDPNKRLKNNTADFDLSSTEQPNHRIDVDVFAKHITVQLEKLPEDVSLQLQTDIFKLIQQSVKDISKVIEKNYVDIKVEDSPELIENIVIF